MVGWILYVNPVGTLLRLALLCVMAALLLAIFGHDIAWSYVLMGAVWCVGLAIIAWILGTLVELLVLIGSLIILFVRGTRGLVLAGRRVVRWVLLLAILLFALTTEAAAQLQVLDVANLAQSTRTALQMVESVLKQAEMIRNQVTQIENMVQNTTGWAGIWDREALPRLQRLGALIGEEQGIAYQMANIDSEFKRRFPGYQPVTNWGKEYELWTRTTMDTLRGTLNSARLQAEDFATEEARLQLLQRMSDSAAGRMQALQVGNMMAAEQIQQLVSLRQLIIAQMNAQNVYMASVANKDAQQDATESHWIRNGINHLPSKRGAPSVAP